VSSELGIKSNMMKKLLLSTLLFLTIIGHSQTMGITYQAVILNPNSNTNTQNDVLANSKIVIQFTIENVLNNQEYQEYHYTITDEYGMINLLIGNGIATGINDFNDIIWDGKVKRLKVEMDFSGEGNDFEPLSEQNLTYMPHPSNNQLIQDLQIVENALTITGNGSATTIDLSSYLDNTDTQLTDAAVKTIIAAVGYLTAEVDGSVTNEIQDLQIVENALTITGNGSATTIDLSSYLDNTDTQLTDAAVKTIISAVGYLTAEVDGSVTNEIQDLQIVGNKLKITNNASASEIDLSPYVGDTTLILISDADNDTKVEVESTNDEDAIRFSTGNANVSIERMTIDSAGNTKIGDGVNNTYIEPDGSLSYEGTAVRWVDLKVNVQRLTSRGVKPPGINDVVDLGAGPGLFTYWFDNDTEEELFFTVQMPHGWLEGSDIKPHVHWVGNTGSGNVEWGLEYSWANVNDLFSGTSITLTAYTAISTYADYKHMLTPLGSMDGSGKKLSSILLCRIYRNATSGNDTFTQDSGLLQIDFHYQIDSDGSREELTK